MKSLCKSPIVTSDNPDQKNEFFKSKFHNYVTQFDAVSLDEYISRN